VRAALALTATIAAFGLGAGGTEGISVPEGGVSLLDAPGQPFHDPAADAALFETLEAKVVPSAHRKLIRLPGNVNDSASAAALVTAFREIAA
jgi:uncharacterized protein (UPF0261 family)